MPNFGKISKSQQHKKSVKESAFEEGLKEAIEGQKGPQKLHHSKKGNKGRKLQLDSKIK